MATAEQLKANASVIAKACKEALDWCGSSSDESIRNDKTLTRDLRMAVVAAERLKFAASSKMAVGVFGPSQAGKSYLISALARAVDGTVMSSFGGRQEDFIAKINPEGGKESTGLVTRFTYSLGSAPVDPAFPVQVGLLNEVDIIKILTNSYVEDVIHQTETEIEEHQAEIEKIIEDAQGQGVVGQGLPVEAVFDLETYAQKTLLKNTRISALRRFGYWQTAIEVVPMLPPEARVKFFSALWEGLPTYTEIYRRLQAQLIKLDFAKQISCEPAALFDIQQGTWQRSTKSIIDVATLGDLCDSPSDFVTVRKPSGGQVQVERSEITALVSELVIHLTECPHPFFAHTDLLDFPGARSRQPQPRERLSDREVRAESFLRGKVAYLFERYSDDRELSAMLLCVGPSNQEVVGLGDLIERWIELTHGASPEERSKVPCTLLFVLTKFDTAFEQGAGKNVDGTRWSTRLEASLLKPFGTHSHRTKWVSNWDTAGKFKNVFWLRNPNYRQDALFAYGDQGVCQEISIRQDKENFVSELRQAFIDNALVHDYFKNPAEAWDKALLINDGGISRIIAAIEPICQPSVKLDQVNQQLVLLAGRVVEVLQRYYVSSDLGELRKQKTELATQLVKVLGVSLQRGRLGELISALRLDEGCAKDAYYQSVRAATPASTLVNALESDNLETESLDLELATILGVAPVNKVDATNAATSSTHDFAQIYAENLLLTWITQINEQSRNPNVITYYGVTPQIFLNIAHEIEISLRKCGLFDRLANEVRANRGFLTERQSTWVWKQVAPVTNRFNDFVDHAGHVIDSPSGVTVQGLNGTTLKIFGDSSEANPIESLTEETKTYERRYLTEWLQGLQATVRTNADYLSGVSGDVESNTRLGNILHTLRTYSQTT